MAGEIKSSDFDVSNSPVQISNYAGDTLILKTTNGTKVLENIKQRNSEVNILVGASINAKTVAQKALDIADNEIDIIKQLINTSHSADKLRYLGFGEDIEICSLINKIDTVPIYKNNYIVSLD